MPFFPIAFQYILVSNIYRGKTSWQKKATQRQLCEGEKIGSFAYLTMVRNKVERASLWNVIITLVGGRSLR